MTMADHIRREPDMDELRDAADERRRMRMMTGCRCGNDLPGYCPGPVNCPYSGVEVEDEDEADPDIMREDRDELLRIADEARDG